MGCFEMHGAPLHVRFVKHSPERPEGACWLWQSAIGSHGYGVLRVDGKTILATHVSLQLDGRPRPSPASLALHSCDVKACVNPAHLRWGTRKDNAQDAVRRGLWAPRPRQAFCKRGHDQSIHRYDAPGGSSHCGACVKARRSLPATAADLLKYETARRDAEARDG